MKHLRLAVVAGALAVGGCASSGDALGPYPVTCDGIDAPMTATFMNGDAPIVRLSWADRELVLPQTRSASGARYAATRTDGAYVFWNKGNEATFTMPDGRDRHCEIADGR